MIDASCHCGAITIRLAAAPETVTQCTCSICRRYGVLWAYYPPDQVVFQPTTPVTDTYQWGDRSITFHRCAACGCVTHWAPVDPTLNRMGVNARLMPLDLLTRTRIRHFDGAVTERYLDE